MLFIGLQEHIPRISLYIAFSDKGNFLGCMACLHLSCLCLTVDPLCYDSKESIETTNEKRRPLPTFFEDKLVPSDP